MLIKMNKIVFILLLAIFFLHQLLQKVLDIAIPIADAYLDDVLCIPILLYLWNWEKRVLWRYSDYKIKPLESLWLTIILALVFEWGFPILSNGFTYDKLDFLAYGLGWALYWLLSSKQTTYCTDNSLNIQ